MVHKVWSTDLVSGELFDGRPIRILAVLDAHTREALSIVPRVGFRVFTLVLELDRLTRERGRPRALKMDNGPEFARGMLDQWAHLNGVKIDLSAQANPRTTRTPKRSTPACGPECLNASWLLSVADARDRLEAWRREYDDEQPHGSLRNLIPTAFAE